MTEQSPASVAHIEQQTLPSFGGAMSASETTVQPPTNTSVDEKSEPSSPLGDKEVMESRHRNDSDRSLSDCSSHPNDLRDGVCLLLYLT